MSSIILILISIASFLFYGVVGQDKAPLLGPAIVIGLLCISVSFIRKSCQLSAACFKPSADALQPPTSNLQHPTSSVLWLLFLLFGALMVPDALMTYEAKVRMLFIGAVVGSFLVWGRGLTAFKDNRLVLGGLIFVVMLLALYGMIIHFKNPDSILWTERYTDHYDGRLASTYICPNHFAHLMQMLLPFCISLLFIPQAGIYLKLLAAYSFLVMLPPLFLTESRAGWLGSIAGVGVVICLMALRRSKKLFAGLVILVPLFSVLILFAGWRYSETFQRRMAPVVEFLEGQAEEGVGSDSPDFRPLTWLDTLDMIAANPVVGYGPGTYRYAYPEFRKRFKGKRILTGHPHNEYLELSAEFGLVGFGLFALAWIWGAIWVLIKSMKAEETRHAFMGFAFLGAVAGTMVHSFFDFQMHIFPNAMIFALLAALASGPLRAAKRRGQRTEVRGEGVRAYGRKGENEGLRTEERGVEVSAYGRKGEDGSQRPDGLSRAVAGTAGAGQSVERGMSDVEKLGSRSQRSEDRGRKSEGRDKMAVDAKPSTFHLLLSTTLSWLLAAGFLLSALYSIPVMASGVLNALADRRSEATIRTPDAKLQTTNLYRLATRFASDNWRAYRGQAQLIQTERWHSLDREEKGAMAVEQQRLYEKAVEHNPKDPESLMALGRTCLFLSRQPTAISSQPNRATPVDVQTTNAKLQTDGLQLLRDACGYRKFNDEYWWILGVELRKMGLYEEALEAFRHMETIRRTKSSRMNIQWLERQLTGDGGRKTEDGRLRAEDGRLRAEDGRSGAEGDEIRAGLQSTLEGLAEEGEAEGGGSLDDLFRLMEKE